MTEEELLQDAIRYYIREKLVKDLMYEVKAQYNNKNPIYTNDHIISRMEKNIETLNKLYTKLGEINKFKEITSVVKCRRCNNIEVRYIIV